MQNLKCNLIVFGFGPITNHLINDVAQVDKKIICVTDHIDQSSDVKSKNDVQFVSRKEVSKFNLNCDSAIFAWKDLSRLTSSNHEFQKWLISTSFNCNYAVHLSSASVYQDKSGPIDESENNLDSDAISNDKYLLENAISHLMKVKLVPYCNLRISNVYGLDLKYGFIASLLDSIRTSDPVKIFTNREILRDYISVQDVIFAVKGIITSQPPNKVVNVSTGIANSISEVLKVFSNLGFRFDDAIEINAADSIKNSLVLDCNLLSQIINWQPLSLEQGIKAILKPILQFEPSGGV